MSQDKIDMVNNPPHYKTGKLEVIDILEDQLTQEEFCGYLRGNILKYLFRYKNKGGVTDLQKAQWYTARLVGHVGVNLND
jgi:hypothetical protein|tara:strand:- start:7429 stop:7668 length:240 start_codon:yes stop_codon:yes gene_type:complete